MEIKEFGVNNKKKVLFLHGAVTKAQWYLPSIEKLSRKWHIYVPIYKGYDHPFEDSFQSVENTADEIVQFCKEKGIDEFDTVYGLSMGGVIGLLLYSYHRIPMKNLIIDGSTKPYEYPKFITQIVVQLFCISIDLMRKSKSVIQFFFPPERWVLLDEIYDEIHQFFNQMTRKTIRNSFDSSLNYKLPEKLPEYNAKLYYLYGEKEGGGKDNARFFQRIYPPLIQKVIPDCEHGELCMVKPEEFYSVICEIVG